jgi:hypothetical protein
VAQADARAAVHHRRAGVDLGLNAESLIAFNLSPYVSGYTPERVPALYKTIVERMQAQPGVTGVAFASVGLLEGNEWDSTVTVEGYEAKPGEQMNPFCNSVSPATSGRWADASQSRPRIAIRMRGEWLGTPFRVCRGDWDGLKAVPYVRHVVLTKRQIESSNEIELAWRGAGDDPRDAVIAQARRAAEDERIARLERDRLNWFFAFQPAEQKPRRVADRDRHNRDPRRDRSLPFVLVLMQSHPAVGIVVIEDAQVGVDRHPR